MNYFLSIVLDHQGRYIYRLAKGLTIRDCRPVADISRRGAILWFNQAKMKPVYHQVRNNTEGTVYFVNRAFQCIV
jgi:hypothetical protein